MNDNSWVRLLPPFVRDRIKGRLTLQKIIANTGWLFADKIVRMGLGVVVGIWLARYLGPQQFGSLNFVMALVALFSTLSTLGLESIVVRDIVHDESCADRILGSATVLKFAGSLLTVTCSAITIMIIRPGDTTSLWMSVAISACAMFQSLDTIDFWFQSHLKSKYAVFARNSAFIATALIRIVLIVAKAPLIVFAVSALVEAAIAAGGLVLYYVRDGNLFSRWQVSGKQIRYLLNESWPLILQGIVIMVYMRIDQVMLGQLAGDISVGEFSAAGRLVEVWYFIPLSITASLFPEIIKSRKLSLEQYEGRIQSMYDLMIWMAICMALAISFTAPHIINLLYGTQYRNAAMVLSLQTWMATMVFFGVARQKWLAAEGYLKEILYVEIAGMLINVSVNLYLIPRYGAVGASVASLVAAFCANLVGAIFSRPIRKSIVMYGKSLMLPFRIAGLAGKSTR